MRSRENKGLSWEDTRKMPVTTRVIQETMRVSSILSFMFREAIQDVEFQHPRIKNPKSKFPKFIFSLSLSPISIFGNATCFQPVEFTTVSSPLVVSSARSSPRSSPLSAFAAHRRAAPPDGVASTVVSH